MNNDTLPSFSSSMKRHWPWIGSLALVLLLVLGLEVSGWQWEPQAINSDVARVLMWVSQSVTAVTLVLLALLFYKLRLRWRKNVLLLVCMAVVLLLGAGVKRGLKGFWQEPRPYVVWLEKQSYVASAQAFYQLPNKKAFVRGLDLSDTAVPRWQQQYWSNNTGYSFPSGHSLFALQMMLLMMTLLWRKQAYVLMALTVGWAAAVLAGRLLLGMHWPADLLLSGALALVLNVPFALLWNRPQAKVLEVSSEVSSA